MKKASFTLLIFYLLFLSINVYSGGVDKTPLAVFKAVTPNAGSLGQYGQVPVNLYNGLVDISIPIYTIQTRNISVPISLKYYAGGNRVDDHPGWVGLGWSLHAGGVITRITNGIYDEADKYVLKDITTIGLTDDYYGYFYRSNVLTDESWCANSFWKALLEIGGNISFHEIDTQPDEFLVSCDGFTASLYFYRTSNNEVKVKIKSKDGQVVKAETNIDKRFFTLKDKKNNSRVITCYNAISKFKLTTSNGMQYIFGNDNNSIDYSINASTKKAIPTSWYLTKIISQLNDTVSFNYTKENVPAVESRCRYHTTIENDNDESCVYYRDYRALGCSEYSYSILYPSHLANIQWPNGGKITFSTSKSNELTAIDSLTELNRQVTVPLMNDDDFDYSSLNYHLKLDKMNINNQLYFDFCYADNSTQRLRLLSLKCADKNNEVQNSYFFGYNQTKLPRYNSKKTDNWGYYNGKDYSKTDFKNLYSYRTPDVNLMQAEMLDTITYPTGGKVIFEYEPHDFSKIVDYREQKPYIPFCLKDSIAIAGGVRIKKIITLLSSGRSFIKQYEYKNSNLTSSGILSNMPVYTTMGTANDTTWTNDKPVSYKYIFLDQSENPINWLDRSNGNHVTYSRVTEKMEDNSKKVFLYSNHNDFPDLTPQGICRNFEEHVLETKYTSRDIERGMLNRIEYYNNNGYLVKKEENFYNNDNSRYNNSVKSIYSYGKGLLIYAGAIPIYTFYPYLKSQRITEYNPNTKDSIQQQTYYTYDANNFVKEIKSSASNGDILRTVINYSGNYTQDPYTSMKKRFMVGLPIETTRYLNNFVVQSDLKTYKQIIINTDTMYLPDKSYMLENRIPLSSFSFFDGAIKDSNYSLPDIEYISYDYRGNIREVTDRAGIHSTYLWGYNYQYPIAEIKNATYSQVLTVLGLNSVDTQISSFSGSNIVLINKLRSLLPNSMINTYTYRPNIGMSTATQPRGITTRYIYDTNNRLATVLDNKQFAVNSYNYAYYNTAGSTVNDYSALTGGTVVLGASQYKIDSIGSATCNVNGGSGDYTYSWYLKNSSNTILQSSINSLSNKFSFVCSQAGTLTLQCVLIDNQTEQTATINQSVICIDPCAECFGRMYKCIDGVCETGVKTYISCSEDSSGLYICTYVYTFTDGSTSSRYIEKLKYPPAME